MTIQSLAALKNRAPLGIHYLPLNTLTSRRIDFFKYVYCFSTKTHSPSASLVSVTKQKLHAHKEAISFEHFKKTQMESLEEYKKSYAVKQVLGDDVIKISKAYEGYCQSKYSRYRQFIYGGNPATMI